MSSCKSSRRKHSLCHPLGCTCLQQTFSGHSRGHWLPEVEGQEWEGLPRGHQSRAWQPMAPAMSGQVRHSGSPTLGTSAHPWDKDGPRLGWDSGSGGTRIRHSPGIAGHGCGKQDRPRLSDHRSGSGFFSAARFKGFSAEAETGIRFFIY